MASKEELIPFSIKNYSELSRKKKEWWVWLIASLFVVLGIGLSVTSLVLLCISYCCNNPLAAYAGAIGAGLTIALAGLTQILVFIHRKEDEKAKRLDKVEHDYTNFFIKNYHWNEMISLILSNVNEKLGVSLVFSREEKCIKVSYDNSIKDFKELRRRYLMLLSSYIYQNEMFTSMLDDKYKLGIKGMTISRRLFNLFSSFDTEIKKASMSVEKFLQAKSNHKYEDKFYDYNMGERIEKFARTIMPYFIIIIHDNSNYSFAAKVIELLPFMVYYLSKETH